MRYIREGNQALERDELDIAEQYYRDAKVHYPELASLIDFNLAHVEKLRGQPGRVKAGGWSSRKRLSGRITKLPLTVMVITWDVGHNPLGRSYMLAEVLQKIARHVILVGFQFERYGKQIWEPVRNGKLPVIAIPGGPLPDLLDRMRSITQRFKPDLVVACKARLPSVELGLMLREQWGCPLIVDVDDHELTFTKQPEAILPQQVLAGAAGAARNEREPYSDYWTRLSDSLARRADAVVVSNVALQEDFGGVIVPHVRDEERFDPVLHSAAESRRKYGLPARAKLLMFFGTPRLHKGVQQLAQAVGELNDDNIRLVVVGEAPDRSVVSKLDQLARNRVNFLGNQPFDSIPEIIAAADLVCLPQDVDSPISRFQLPAKAIDAVAMNIPLLVSRVPPLMQLVDDGVASVMGDGSLAAEIQAHLKRKPSAEIAASRRRTFLESYSYNAAAASLQDLIKSLTSKNRKIAENAADRSSAQGLIAHALDVKLPSAVQQTRVRARGQKDVVVFWKQNDTTLYGRRHDMVIRYLASRPDIGKVVVFDAPISEWNLMNMLASGQTGAQHRSVYVASYEKKLGLHDTDKIAYNVFISEPGRYGDGRKLHEDERFVNDYCAHIEEVLQREGVCAAESVFLFYPRNYSAIDLINRFKPACVVTDVVDDHRAWPNVSDEEKQQLTGNYRTLLSRSAHVMTNCEPVQQSMSEFHRNVQMIPNGCEDSPQVCLPLNSPLYERFKNWNGPKIGYVGNLEAKIDINLLVAIAENFPDALLVLIGSNHSKLDLSKLQARPNVMLTGVVNYREVGAWVSEFSAAIVPHKNMELTRSMNPLKIYVYLANGVPVVSTEVQNIALLDGIVHVASSHSEFLGALRRVLQDINRAAVQQACRAFVAENSWSKRLSGFFDRVLDKAGA